MLRLICKQHKRGRLHLNDRRRARRSHLRMKPSEGREGTQRCRLRRSMDWIIIPDLLETKNKGEHVLAVLPKMGGDISWRSRKSDPKGEYLGDPELSLSFH